MGTSEIQVATMETVARLKEKSFSSLEEKVRAVMEGLKDHWMVTSDEDRFAAALGSTMLLTEGEERERVDKEIRILNSLGAMQRGVPVDFAALGNAEDYDPVGFVKLWKEITGVKKK